jgi:hypothetical protein
MTATPPRTITAQNALKHLHGRKSRRLRGRGLLSGLGLSGLLLITSLNAVLTTGFTIPSALFLLAMTIVVVAVVLGTVQTERRLRHARAHNSNVCPWCEYPLDPATSPRQCPECGATFTPDVLAWYWNPQSRYPGDDRQMLVVRKR